MFFSESACLWYFALVAWGHFTWGGVLWRFEICMQNMEKNETQPLESPPGGGGGGLESSKPPPPHPQVNHLEEKLSDQA